METVLGCGAVLLAAILFWAAGTTITMFAWNYVAAGVFGAPELSFWQVAAAVLIIGVIGNCFKAVVCK